MGRTHTDVYAIRSKIDEPLSRLKLVWFTHSYHKTGTSTSVDVSYHETTAVYVVNYIMIKKRVVLFIAYNYFSFYDSLYTDDLQ